MIVYHDVMQYNRAIKLCKNLIKNDKKPFSDIFLVFGRRVYKSHGARKYEKSKVMYYICLVEFKVDFTIELFQGF